MADVFRKDGSPYWYYDIPATITGGKRERRSTKLKSKRDAQAFADKLEKDYLNRRVSTDENREVISFEDAVSWHIDRHQHLSDVQNKQYLLFKFMGQIAVRGKKKKKPKKGELPVQEAVKMHQGVSPKMLVSELRNRHLDDIQKWRLADGVAIRTINAELAAVRAMYNDMKQYDAFVLPPDMPDFAKYIKPVANKAKPLSDEELDRLLKELDPRNSNAPMSDAAYKAKCDNYDFCIMLVDTGLRYDELAKLPWSMVDKENFDYLHIYRSKVDNDDMLGSTDRVRTILRRRYAERKGSHYVFTDATGKGPRKYANKGITKAFERAGINVPEKTRIFGSRTIHSLRDTFATRIRRKGMGIDGIQKLLGHASSTMTEKYAHIDTYEVSRQAVNLLND